MSAQFETLPPDVLKAPAPERGRLPESVEAKAPNIPPPGDAPASVPESGIDLFNMSHPLAQDLMLNPGGWRLWPAIGVLRWLLRRASPEARRLMYRFRPSLAFPTSEIDDVALETNGAVLNLNALGLAATGSPLPKSDIARIIQDHRGGGAMAAWLDGPADRLMHALEEGQFRNNAAFALATGGQLEATVLASRVAGRSAPLSARAGGVLSDTFQMEPEGSVGLAGLFLGSISASGLAELFRAFTELPVRVKEFTGAEVITLRPARVGGPVKAVLGSRCRLPAAGVEIVIDGGSRPAARNWARDRARRRSLHALASAYIGSPSPQASLFLQLNPDNAPPAVLDGQAALGGLAVLGEAKSVVRLPLAG